ncbi:MAG: hypothetical protein ACYDD5_00480 [Sulfuricurvum sp.]
MITSAQANNLATLFMLLKSPSNYLEVHDALMEHCTVLTQYYAIKAFRVVTDERPDYQNYYDFAHASVNSKHGQKAVFFNIQNKLYSSNDYDLKWCHKPADGLPKLQEVIDLARTIL